MSDDLTLEQELELQLLEPETQVSTPRQRLEDARMMADGVVFGNDGSGSGCLEERQGLVTNNEDGVSSIWSIEDEEQETSTLLLQRLSRDMADAGGWESFHSIKCESQSVLAEMNETLGSLRQWQKQRDLTLKSPDLEGEPAAGQPLSGTYPVDSVETTTAGTSVDAVDDTDDPLLRLWQERNLRARQAAQRLQTQLGSAWRPRDDTLAATAIESNACDTHPTSLHDLARKGVSEQAGGKDRAEGLRRDAESLGMHQLIENVRVQACDHATNLAREACEDIRRGTESVEEMESELICFTEDLDSLLLRLDIGDVQEAAAEHGVVAASPRDERAPAADAHVGRAEGRATTDDL